MMKRFVLALGLWSCGIGLVAAPPAAAQAPAATPEHVYFIGAHPDDMIGMAALAFAVSTNARFRVHVVDLTRGGAGLAGVSTGETCRVRSAEERKACALLGVEPVFLEEPDGAACAGRGTCEKLAALFRAAPPRAVITHWPVDEHMDHVACYAVVMNAIRFARLPRRPELYFFEESIQTRSMPVMFYFPFGQDLMDRKSEFVRCYSCQNPGDGETRRKILEAKYHGWKSAAAPYAEPYGAFYPRMPGARTIFDEL